MLLHTWLRLASGCLCSLENSSVSLAKSHGDLDADFVLQESSGLVVPWIQSVHWLLASSTARFPNISGSTSLVQSRVSYLLCSSTSWSRLLSMRQHKIKTRDKIWFCQRRGMSMDESHLPLFQWQVLNQELHPSKTAQPKPQSWE